ncbi:MAG: 5-oxoprolinase subunit PxpB [Syntrophales bacterium]
MNYPLFDELRFRLSGDRALLVDCGEDIDPAVNEKVLRLASQLRRKPPQGVQAIVPAYRCFAVIYDPLLTGPDILKREISLLENAQDSLPPPGKKVVRIPVCYGREFGPDMDFVSSVTNLDPEGIIAIHSAREYPVYMLGFTPGFCYLGGMDERLRSPRRETPRVSIAAGSVGIAELQTGMYPVASPGGWQIIGKTPLRLFAPERQDPFLYKAGDRIRFEPISRDEFERLSQKERS